MDDVINRLAKELSEAIADAVAHDSDVAAVRESARSQGFEMKVSLEAVIGFKPRRGSDGFQQSTALVKRPWAHAERKHEKEFNLTDKRFLRSLRIAADSTEAAEDAQTEG